MRARMRTASTDAQQGCRRTCNPPGLTGPRIMRLPPRIQTDRPSAESLTIHHEIDGMAYISMGRLRCRTEAISAGPHTRGADHLDHHLRTRRSDELLSVRAPLRLDGRKHRLVRLSPHRRVLHYVQEIEPSSGHPIRTRQLAFGRRRTPWKADYSFPTDVGRQASFVPYTAFASPAIIFETVYDTGGRLVQLEGAPRMTHLHACTNIEDIAQLSLNGLHSTSRQCICMHSFGER